MLWIGSVLSNVKKTHREPIKHTPLSYTCLFHIARSYCLHVSTVPLINLAIARTCFFDANEIILCVDIVPPREAICNSHVHGLFLHLIFSPVIFSKSSTQGINTLSPMDVCTYVQVKPSIRLATCEYSCSK